MCMCTAKKKYRDFHTNHCVYAYDNEAIKRTKRSRCTVCNTKGSTGQHGVATSVRVRRESVTLVGKVMVDMRHGRGRPLGAVKPSWEGNRDVHGGASRRRPATEIASQVWACLFGPYLSPYLSLSSPNLCFYLCRLQGVGVSCHATNRGHRTHHDGRQCSKVGPVKKGIAVVALTPPTCLPQ